MLSYDQSSSVLIRLSSFEQSIAKIWPFRPSKCPIYKSWWPQLLSSPHETQPCYWGSGLPCSGDAGNLSAVHDETDSSGVHIQKLVLKDKSVIPSEFPTRTNEILANYQNVCTYREQLN